MRTTVLSALVALSTFLPATLSKDTPTPTIPNTAEASSTLEAQVTFPTAPTVRTREDASPVSLSIPSVKLRDAVVPMGVLTNGQLDVPSGATRNVGWYAAGTLPGQKGSAVLDAHVFAAFKNLRYAKPGDDIYVTSRDGAVLHFKVETSEVFKLGQLTSNYLFERDDAKRLTLITCAGHLTPDHSTYDHRLVVSAVLVD